MLSVAFFIVMLINVVPLPPLKKPSAVARDPATVFALAPWAMRQSTG
jgi:hypothetical protein